MKIALIRPSRVYYKESLQLDLTIQRMSIPLGLMYLSAVLKREGYTHINLYDCLVSPDTSFTRKGDFIFHGIEDSALVEKLRRFNPDIIGVTNNFTAQSTPAMNTVASIREAFPGVKIVIGGCHSTVKAEELLENSTVDYIVLGEGEHSFLNLVKCIESGCSPEVVKGIGFRQNGRVCLFPAEYIGDLDSIPYPDYDAVDMEFYFNRRSFFKKKYEAVGFEGFIMKTAKKLLMKNRWSDARDIPLITSRGCPYHCVFCSIHTQFGKKFRAHSSEYIVDHIKMLVEKYKINVIHFEDDNISFNLKRFERILSGILENAIRIVFDFPNGMRGDTLNRQLIKKMIKAGCANVTVAVESGDQDILNRVVKKSLKIEDIDTVLSICKEEGIPTSTFFIIGIPGETKETIKRTVDLARYWEKKYGTYTHLAKASPLPGTDLDKIVREKGYYAVEPSEDNFNKMAGFNGVMIHTEKFSVNDIRQFYSVFYRRDRIYKYYFFGFISALRQFVKPSAI